MKEGDVIVCVNNGQIDYKPNVKGLTIGKKYIIIKNIQSEGIQVINDNNQKVFYDSKRFITINKYRNDKLNYLGI